MKQSFKLRFIDRMVDVTFLCPNKKVTKEVVRGASGKCILAPDPTPAALTTAH